MMRWMILAILFSPAAAAAAGPHYFTVVRNGACSTGADEACMEQSYSALEKMVQLADVQNLKLTLLFSAWYADYISTDAARTAALAKWRITGHETGAWHQGPDTKDWDGYSALTGAELKKMRGGKTPAAVPGPAEFFASIKRLEPELKSACITGKADKAFAAAGPVYETCAKAGAAGTAGVNYSLLPPGGTGARKFLSTANPSDRGGVEAAKKSFLRMKGGAYGAAFKSAPSEFGAFYAWLAFLKEQDPAGARSLTAAGTAEQGIIPEQAPLQARAGTAVRSSTAPAVEGTAIPRLKPVKSIYSLVDDLVPSKKGYDLRTKLRAACGDGICSDIEKLPYHRCIPDCGLKDK